MSNPDKTCFFPEPGDTNSFGTSVAINDKYLVVGDPNANRVIVYENDLSGRWQRHREIYPPKNSIIYQVGNGFGQYLWLDKNGLIVNSITRQFSKTINFNTPPTSYFERYFIQLDTREVTKLEVTEQKKEDFLQFYILSDGKLKLVELPNSDRELSTSSIELFNSFAVHNDLLLICSPSPYTKGKGWLFNLKSLEELPTELTTKNGYLGDTVALSDQFAIVGNSGTRRFNHDYLYHPETLIKSLKNDSTMVTDIQGRLSLEGNILAVMLPSSRSYFRAVALLQLFRIDEDATPNLILERTYSRRGEKYLVRAWVQNGWLMSVYRINRTNSIELCLESVEQITGK